LAAVAIFCELQPCNILKTKQNGSIFSVKAKKLAPKLKPSRRNKWLTLLQKHAANQAAGLPKSKNRYRIVVDTNILISAILYGGEPEITLRHVLAHQEMVLSDYTIDEFVNFLKIVRPKVSQKFVRQVRQKLVEYCHDYDIPSKEEIRDINDTDILRLAIAQKAFIITGDKDILEHKSQSNVEMMTIAEYSELFMINNN